LAVAVPMACGRPGRCPPRSASGSAGWRAGV